MNDRVNINPQIRDQNLDGDRIQFLEYILKFDDSITRRSLFFLSV